MYWNRFSSLRGKDTFLSIVLQVTFFVHLFAKSCKLLFYFYFFTFWKNNLLFNYCQRYFLKYWDHLVVPAENVHQSQLFNVWFRNCCHPLNLLKNICKQLFLHFCQVVTKIIIYINPKYSSKIPKAILTANSIHVRNISICSPQTAHSGYNFFWLIQKFLCAVRFLMFDERQKWSDNFIASFNECLLIHYWCPSATQRMAADCA